MDASVETFHNTCQMDTCPVCYYIKNPDLMKSSACMECNSSDSLWFCIVCANVACGDGLQGHATDHFKKTDHKFGMKLQTFIVWNFKTKTFLHKLNARGERFDEFYTYNEADSENICPCPICQHVRTPKLLKNPVCMKCQDDEMPALWICLSCNHIGCGKNKNNHAIVHFKNTKHPCAMSLNNFSIWDYEKKKYQQIQLHEEVAVKSESERLKEDFEKRIHRLEREWEEFSKLTEANIKLIIIEERLLSLTNEKKVLEEKLYDHDAKLNELLTKFDGNRENSSFSTENSTSDVADVTTNGFLRNSKYYFFFKLFLQNLVKGVINLF